MAKGEGVQYPKCKLCDEPHRIEAGKVCPKFRSKKIDQPKPKQLEAPKKKAT